MLILILLLKFNDFELSGQNFETETMFLKKLKELMYWNIFVTYCMYDVCILYIDKAKEHQTSSL